MINLIKQNKVTQIFLILFLSFWIILLCLPSFFSFPINYGWWQAYVYFEQNGLELYKDINLVFPPFFVRVTEFFFSISENIAANFLFGIGRIFLLFLVFYLIFKQFFNFTSSIICSFIIVIYQIELSTFVPDDYHIMERTLFGISILLFLKLTLKEIKLSSQLKWHAFLSISLIFLILCKQNIGVFVTASTFLGLLILSFKRYLHPITIFIFLINFIIFTPVICYLLGLSTDTMYSLIFENDAKGNNIYLLSKVFLLESNRIFLIYGIPVGAILFLYNNYLIKKEFFLFKLLISFKNIRNFFSKHNLISIFLWLPLLIYLIKPPIIIIIGIAITVYLLLTSVLIKESRYSFISYIFSGLLYGSTLTSSFAIDSNIMIVAFLYGYIFHYIFGKDLMSKFRFTNTIQILIILLIFLFTIMIKKINVPYNWWGFNSNSITQSNFKPPYEELKDLRIDKATFEILENIKEDISLYSISKNDLYLYPHLPFFYFLHKKFPLSNNPVQWFDVITNRDLEEDIELIKQKKPNVIIMFDPPYETYLGHESLKSDYLRQYQFLHEVYENYELKNYVIFKNSVTDNFSALVKNKYKDLVTKDFDSENFVELTIKLKKDFTIKSLREMKTTHKIDARAHKNNLNTFEIVQYHENGITYAKHDFNNKGMVFKKNSLITLKIHILSADNIIRHLGIIPKPHENWYSLKTFVRN